MATCPSFRRSAGPPSPAPAGRASRRIGALAFLLVAAAMPLLAGAADGPGVRTETLYLRASVGADGHVLSTRPFDARAALAQVAQLYAAKLVFTPARRDGRAVPATTCLTMRFVAEPRPDGAFGVRLRRAVSGPCVVTVGKTEAPKVGGENGALVVVGANLQADGHVDPGSLATESVQMRVPSSFAEARYVEAAQKSLRGSRFELDTVDGQPVPAHVSAPIQFGSGPAKPPTGAEGERGVAPDAPLPSWNARSLLPNVELPKLDYTAP
jgi:hypothetical protein